jgi:hypothetical protein
MKQTEGNEGQHFVYTMSCWPDARQKSDLALKELVQEKDLNQDQILV